MAVEELQENGWLDSIQRDRAQLIGGGTLVAIGGLLGFAGMVLVGSAVIGATRRWMDQLEPAPRELARRKWQQARSAVSAGVSAWNTDDPRRSPAA